MVKVEGKGLINFFCSKGKELSSFLSSQGGGNIREAGDDIREEEDIREGGVISGSIRISVIFRLKVVL